MTTIVTRSGKGAALTHAEMDANLDNLNNDKPDVIGTPTTGNLASWDANDDLQDSGQALPTGTLVGTTDTQTLTNKTLTNPTVTTGTFTDPVINSVTVDGTPWHSGNDGAGTGLDADTVDGNQASALLARANHTGTQLLSTISDSGSFAALSAVPSDHVTNAMQKQPTSGTTYVIGRDLTESSSTSLTYVASSTRLICLFDGTIDTSFTIKSGTGGSTVYGRVYKNGVAAGTEQTTTSSTYVSKTDSGITVSRGDYLEVYIHSNGSVTVYTKDLQIKSAADTPFVAVTW